MNTPLRGAPFLGCGALVRRWRRPEARSLVDLSDFQPAELSDSGPALTAVKVSDRKVWTKPARGIAEKTIGWPRDVSHGTAPGVGIQND